MIIFFLLSCVVQTGCITVDCNCGFAGLCLKDRFNSLSSSTCDVCNRIGESFYDGCNLIFNHCDSSPCVAGDCVPTFGSYYCECPSKHYGQACQFFLANIEEFNVTNAVHIYYQLQTAPNGYRPNFYVVYDPGNQTQLLNYNETGLKLQIDVADGRTLFPTGDDDFALVNVKEKCHEDVREFPTIFDQRVCQLLPPGEHKTFTLDPLFRTPLIDSQPGSEIILGGIVVGILGHVSVKAYWMNSGRKESVFYDWSFPLFTYKISNIVNDCHDEVNFDGCSSRRRHPRISPRWQQLTLYPIIKYSNPYCKTPILKAQWYLQQNVSFKLKGKNDMITGCIINFGTHSVKSLLSLPEICAQRFLVFGLKLVNYCVNLWELFADDMKFPLIFSYYDTKPKLLSFGNRKQIIFPKMFFIEGSHTIELILTMKGDPPFYGGISTYTRTGRCFVDIKAGEMNVRIRGGDSFAVSCYNGLDLKIISDNPGLPTNEMDFRYTCSVTSDPKCNLEQLTTISRLRRDRLECDKTYVFTISAHHASSKNQTITVAVEAISEGVDLMLSCNTNCLVDRQLGYIMVDFITSPYLPSKVMWTYVNPVKGFSKPYMPFNTSRHQIVYTNLGPITTPSIQVSATFRTITTKIIFKLSSWDRDQPEYYLNSTPSLGYYPRVSDQAEKYHKPVRYMILVIFKALQEEVIARVTYSDDKIQLKAPYFKLQGHKMKFCAYDGWDIFFCQKSESFTAPPINTMDNLSLPDLRSSFLMNDLIHATCWIVSGFTGLNSINGTMELTWIGERDSLNNLVDQILGIDFQIEDVLEPIATTKLLKIMSYSMIGNSYGNLVPFKSTFEMHLMNDTTNFKEIVDWVTGRDKLLRILTKLNRWLRKQSYARDEDPHIFLRGYPIWKDLLKNWELLSFQKSTFDILKPQLQKLTNNEVIEIEIQYELGRQVRYLKDMIVVFSEILMSTARPFMILESDPSHYLMTWSLKSIYEQIVEFAKKEIRFSTRYDDTVGNNASLFRILLREIGNAESDVSYQSLLGSQLTMVVILMHISHLEVMSYPSIYVAMRNKQGILAQLPGNAPYTIEFQLLQNFGSDEADNFKQYEANRTVLVNVDSCSIYRFVMPSHLTLMRIPIFVTTPLKMLQRYGSVPRCQEVRKSEVYTPPGLNASGCWFSLSVEKQNSSQETIFYLGMAPEAVRGSRLVVSLGYYTKYCQVVDIAQVRDIEICKTADLMGMSTVHCICNNFGVVSVQYTAIKPSKVFIATLIIIFPPSEQSKLLLMFMIALAFTIYTTIVVWWMDHVRNNKSAMIYAEDTYPTDEHKVLIGVYTGNNIMSGSNTTVAIKLVGSNANSRVHLLRTRLRRTLKATENDWFVITTRKPMERIMSAYIWHDYRNFSEWYCNRMILFDATGNCWYYADVQEWLQCPRLQGTPEVLQIDFVLMNEVECELKNRPDETKENFIAELLNSHHLISPFFLQLRAKVSREQKILIIFLKLVGVLLGTWYVESKTNTGNLKESTDRYLYLSSMIGLALRALAVGTLTYLVTLPYEVIIRMEGFSKLAQHKLSNPVIQGRHGDFSDVASIAGSINRSVSRSVSVDRRSTRRVTSASFANQGLARKSDFSGFPQAGIMRKSDATRYSTAGTSRKSDFGVFPSTQSRMKKYLVLLFRPAQFICINLQLKIFENIKSPYMIYSRVYAFCTLGYAFIGIYWLPDLKYYMGNVASFWCLAVVALILDSVFLNTFLILLKSYILLKIFNVTSRETNLWYGKQIWGHMKPLTFKQYIEVATNKAYKLLPNKEYKKIAKMLVWRSEILELFNSCFSLLLMMLLYQMLSHVHDTDYYYTRRALIAAYRAKSETQMGIHSYSKEFIAASVPTIIGNLPNHWPNNEFLSPDESRWFLDLSSRPIGAASFIFTIPIDEGLNLHKLFHPYFNFATGYLHEAGINESSVTIGYTPIKYADADPSPIMGKSGLYYTSTGNRHIVPIAKEGFKKYYLYLTALLDSIADEEGPNPRVVIITLNLFNCFNGIVTIMDLVIEYLPDGVCTSDMSTTNTKLAPEYPLHSKIRELILIFFVILIVVAFVVRVTKLGTVTYFSTVQGVLTCGLAVSGVISTILTEYYNFNVSYGHRLVKDASFENYIDLHFIKYLEMWDYLSSLLLFGLCCLYNVFVVRRAFHVEKRVKVGFHITMITSTCLLVYTSVFTTVLANTYANMTMHFYINYSFQSVASSLNEEYPKHRIVYLAIWIALMGFLFIKAHYVFLFSTSGTVRRKALIMWPGQQLVPLRVLRDGSYQLCGRNPNVPLQPTQKYSSRLKKLFKKLT